MPGDTARRRHKAAHMRHDASKARTRNWRILVTGTAVVALAIATATACAPANTEAPANPEPFTSPESPDSDMTKLVVNGHGLEVGSSRIRDAREAFGKYMPTLDDMQADADEGYAIVREADPGVSWKVSFKWRGTKATVSGRNETDRRLPIDDLTVDAMRIEWDGPGGKSCGAEIAGLRLGEPIAEEAAKIAEAAGGTTRSEGTTAVSAWEAPTAKGRNAAISLYSWTAAEAGVPAASASGQATSQKPTESHGEALLRGVSVALA